MLVARNRPHCLFVFLRSSFRYPLLSGWPHSVPLALRYGCRHLPRCYPCDRKSVTYVIDPTDRDPPGLRGKPSILPDHFICATERSKLTAHAAPAAGAGNFAERGHHGVVAQRFGAIVHSTRRPQSPLAFQPLGSRSETAPTRGHAVAPTSTAMSDRETRETP